MDPTKLGEKLMNDIETEGLGEVQSFTTPNTQHPIFNNSQFLASLRELGSAGEPKETFGIPQLDALVAQPTQQLAHAQYHAPSTATESVPEVKKSKHSNATVIELVSPPIPQHPAGAGKTSLLHLITAHLILPHSLNSIPLTGQSASVLVLDPLSRFSIPRLAAVCYMHILARLKENRLAAQTPVERTTWEKEIKTVVKRALQHVHIFRPQCYPSLLATLRGMEAYLFSEDQHHSFGRRVGALVLEDMHVFVPSLRAFPTSTESRSAVTTEKQTHNPLAAASPQFATLLMHLSTLLCTPIILSTHSASASTYRAPLPVTWPPGVAVTRLAIRRVEVKKFSPQMSAADAETEGAKRWEVVKRGRHEVWKVGARSADAEGFVFRVGIHGGVWVERDEDGE